MKDRIHDAKGASGRLAGDGPAKPPFSRPFAVDELRSDAAVDIDIEADAQERAALAEIDGLVAIDRLAGRFRVTPQGAAGARVVGEVSAAIVQTCVATLEPFEASVHETVDLSFAPEAEVEALEAAKAASDEFVDLAEAHDPPDPIVDGRIDLGAVAAEFLALGLDPYPRKPGATFDAGALEQRGTGEAASPFAALQRLKRGES